VAGQRHHPGVRVLAEGQAPRAVILSCADSRVSPEWILDAAPSGLFVIRSAGNTAFPDAVASLYSAVDHLGVPLVLVAPIRASLEPGHDFEPGHPPQRTPCGRPIE